MTLSGGFCDNEYFTEPYPNYPQGIPADCPSVYDQVFCLDNVTDGTHWGWHSNVFYVSGA